MMQLKESKNNKKQRRKMHGEPQPLRWPAQPRSSMRDVFTACCSLGGKITVQCSNETYTVLLSLQWNWSAQYYVFAMYSQYVSKRFSQQGSRSISKESRKKCHSLSPEYTIKLLKTSLLWQYEKRVLSPGVLERWSFISAMVVLISRERPW